MPVARTRPAPRGRGAGLPRGRTAIASQPKTAVTFAVPAGACDCHVHVFGDGGGVPVRRRARLHAAAGQRRRTAAAAAALHLSRVVIVQPSVYGSDNSCTLDGMRRLGDRARGVAVIDDATLGRRARRDAPGRHPRRQGQSRNRRRDRSGRWRGATSPPRSSGSRRAAGMCRSIHRLSVIAAAERRCREAAGADRVRPFRRRRRRRPASSSPALPRCWRWSQRGHAYVKVSAAYRSSQQAPAYADVAPLARALIAANPDRIVWGTDWPHPHAASPGRRVRRDHAVLRHRRRAGAEPVGNLGAATRRCAARSWSTIRRDSTTSEPL